jgi:hypothetical protein
MMLELPLLADRISSHTHSTSVLCDCTSTVRISSAARQSQSTLVIGCDMSLLEHEEIPMFTSSMVATKYRAQEHLSRGVNGHSKLRSVHSDKIDNACGERRSSNREERGSVVHSVMSHFACPTTNNIRPLVPSSGSRGRHRNSVEF